MKKIILLVLLILVGGFTVEVITGDYIVKKEDFVFEGHFDYIGSNDDTVYYITTGLRYYTHKIFQYKDGKATLIYACNEGKVQLLEEELIVSTYEKDETGKIQDIILSINLDTFEVTTIDYIESLNTEDNKKGEHHVIGENEDYIFMAFFQRDYETDEELNYYIKKIDKTTKEVTSIHKIFSTEVYQILEYLFIMNEGTIAAVIDDDSNYNLYEVDADDFSLDLISVNENYQLLDWNNETCIFSRNDQGLYGCQILEESKTEIIKSAFEDTTNYLMSHFLIADDFFTITSPYKTFSFDYEGNLINEIQLEYYRHDVFIKDGTLLYLDEIQKDLIFLISSKFQIIEYNPLTKKESKSKPLEYYPEYNEFDGGV